jgi:hypothetical protein
MTQAGCALFGMLHECELSNMKVKVKMLYFFYPVGELWNFSPVPHHLCDLNGTISTDMKVKRAPISCCCRVYLYPVFVDCRI